MGTATIIFPQTIIRCMLSALFVIGCIHTAFSQREARYALETSLDGKTTKVYEKSFCTIQLNSSSGEMNLYTDLATLQTDNKKTDSLLAQEEQIPFAVKATLSDGISGVINDENGETYHKIIGTLTVDNAASPVEVYVRVKNLADKSDVSKALMDVKFEIDPKSVSLPVLSDYFTNTLVFQVNNAFINIIK